MAYNIHSKRALSFNWPIFKNTRKQSIMIMLTWMISAVCFPSLIVHKPFPGQLFEGNSFEKNIHNIAWLGCFNVGTFFCFMAAGDWASLKYFHPSKTNFSKVKCYLVILTEIVCSTVVTCACIYDSRQSEVVKSRI